MERDSFSRVSRDSPENYVFPQNFPTKKLGEITVFYAMMIIINHSFMETNSFVFQFFDFAQKTLIELSKKRRSYLKNESISFFYEINMKTQGIAGTS